MAQRPSDKNRDSSSNKASRQVELTDHAIRQAQRGGIPVESISLAVQYGHVERVRFGRFRRTIRKKEARSLREQTGILPSLLEKAVGCAVIIKETNRIVTVITVLPRHSQRRVPSKRHPQRTYKRTGLWYFPNLN